MRSFFSFLLDLIFPNKCPCCNKIIKWNALICENCIEKFPVKEKNICIRCGKPNCICDSKPNYDYCITSTYYDGVIKKGIINFKLKNGTNFGDYFSRDLIHLLNENNLSKKIDVVTAVPMAKSKRKKRGYNQAEVLAKYIAKGINKPIVNNLLQKSDKTLTQHKLSYRERIKSVVGAFKENQKYDLNGKTVLLCDDVITSGATLNECSAMLKKLGAKSIICAVIATTKKNIENFDN